jgi:hypothetical protein
MIMAAINPYWPVVRDAWLPGLGYLGGETAPVGETAAPPTDIAHRSRGQFSGTRGKMYELDEVRAGQLNTQYQNVDGAFSPVNTGSPYAPGVLPYRRFQRTCQWPPTPNLLTGDQANAGQATPLATGTLLTSTALGMASDYDSNAQVTSDPTAWTGTQVFEASMPAGAVAGSSMFTVCGFPIQVPIAYSPAQPYTWSVYVRCTLGGASVGVTPVLSWLTSSGSVAGTSPGASYTLVGSGTAAWTRIQVTGAPPAGAIAANLMVQYASGPTSAFTMQAAGLQVEANPAASGWQQPGVWYPQFTGWVERFPQSWGMGGTYGSATPVVVDTLAQLSQTIMQDPFLEQALSLNPRFFYPLNDASGATTFMDISGNNQPANSLLQAGTTGTVTAGQGVQSNAAGSGITGITGTITEITNPIYGLSNVQGAMIVLPNTCPAGVPSTSGWTRMIGFRASQAGSQEGALWYTSSEDGYSTITVEFNSTGTLEIAVAQANSNGQGPALVVTPTPNVADGNWHLLIFSLNNTGTTLTVWLDGAMTSTTGALTSPYLSYLRWDIIGAYGYPESGISQFTYNGDVAHVAEFDYPMSGTQAAALYNGWRTGFAGDGTGVRYGRILDWAGYSGPSAIDGGLTTNMGPATDIVGLDALSCLNAVSDTENGDHYVDRSGMITFKARNARYNQLTPVYVFGENTAGGEYPYEDVKYDYDTTRLVTRAQVTQFVTSQMYQWPTNGSAAQQAYGMYTLQRTINVANGSEALSAAQYLVGQYQQPTLRLETVRLHPAAYPALWPVCLSLEIGTRVRVMKRPPAPAPPIQFDGFVEQVAFSMTDQGDAVYNVQISPADLTLYWLAAALHTSLYSAAASGQPTIICTPLPDAAMNPLVGSICSGMQMTLDPGTSIAETLTVHSVQHTTAGYTSCQVTFTGNLAYNHAVGALVCDVLPAGDTNPTYWDSVAALGTSTVLAY